MTVAKLSDDQEREITRLYTQTETPLGVIAQRFGVSDSSVLRIAQRHGAQVRGRAVAAAAQLDLADQAVSRETPPLHLGPIEHQDLIRVAIERIDPSPLNPRKRFDAAELQDLAASMSSVGQLQPIVLRPIDVTDGVRFSIVAGERRFRAAQLLGWKTIAATVRPDLTEQLHARIAMIENLARSDLNPLEEAHGYQQLIDLGMTQEQIAEGVRRSRAAIANAVRLLKAPEPVQAKIRDGALQPSHVLPLLRYEAFPDVVVKIAEIAAERHTPSKELEKGFAELGYEFHHPLTEAKLIASVESYRAEFDVDKNCGKCPFGAFVRGQYTSYCLKPAHFRQLQKEARAVKKAEVDALVEKASADGTPALQLRSLKYGQYENLSYGNLPKACTPKCECRAIALDGTRQVKVCRNPTRYRKLQDEQRRQDEADRKARHKDLSDRCGQILDQVGQVRSRELALVAAKVLSFSGTAPALLNKYGVESKTRRSDAIDFETFAHLEPLVLLKLAVEALLSDDIVRDYAGSRFANWYAGPAPKVEKHPVRSKRAGRPKPEVSVAAAAAEILAEEPGFNPDARLAEEIASEQERLEAEFAAVVVPELAGAGA